MYRPLADRLRPTTLDDVVGQKHILGKNGILSRLVANDVVPNMVFYGPSGTGKTTVANIIANRTNRKLYKLNATTASTSDIRDIIGELDTLLTPGGVLLYLDEIQYFNKKQQQSLLEFIENGKISLISSTTENPYFYVYNALLSRSTVFEFLPVEAEEMTPAVVRAVEFCAAESGATVNYPDELIEGICRSSGGDVRRAINTAELLVSAASPDDGKITLSIDDLAAINGASAVRYDRDGDVHYDLLSAFQKSIRGSDPDAAVHYLARLLQGGDLASVCRRLLVTAAEDVGLAYPMAVVFAKACVDSAFQLGLPEAQIPLADAVILLATSPKSNSGVCAIAAATEDIRSGKSGEVPAHLKDSHYKGAKTLGRGVGYKYAHDYPNHYVDMQFLPDSVKHMKYYKYGENKMEQASKAYWDSIKRKPEN